MSDPLTAALSRVSRVPGVLGALVVETDAGVPVVAEVAQDTEGDAVAALAAALFNGSAQAADAGGFGALENLHLETEDGHVIVAGTGEMVVVVLADRDAHLGRVRLEALRATEAL